MLRSFLCIFFLPVASLANNISVSNVSFTQQAIYLSLENSSDITDYLLQVEVNQKQAFIEKTIVEKNIAHIIRINRLVIPAKTIVELKPLGIYIAVKDLYKMQDRVNLKLTFNNHYKILQVK
jgi:copper(I)-binding protein